MAATSEPRGLLADPALRVVPWADLRDLRPLDRLRELLLPLSWLSLALLAYRFGWTVPALFGSFYFFLTGLRLVHDVFHGNLGLPRWGNHAVLMALSVLMLGSMHAIRLTHLQHHRDCLGPDDAEGATARRSVFGAILTAPWFPVTLHLAALRFATARHRRWIIVDLTLNAAWLAAVGASGSRPLQCFVLSMALGQMLSGFFAVWTVHHDCDRWEEVARTLRSRFKSLLVFNMFYHLEHHLYPRVPTHHLPALASRLDARAVRFSRKPVY